MYILPSPHKCQKCGFTCQYSPHEPHPAPVTDNLITCPACWAQFLKSHIGTMKYSGNIQAPEKEDPQP